MLDYLHLFNAGIFFGPSEETRLNQTADILRTRSAAAARAGANFTFKDAIPSFVGHAICDATESLHSSGYTPIVRAVLG